MVYGHSVGEVLATYGLVVDRRIPLYCWNETKKVAGQISNTLALPLSRDGKVVDRVLVYGEDHAEKSSAQPYLAAREPTA